MDVVKRSAHCPHCQRQVYAERPTGLSDGWGCLLIVLTGGLFLPVFLLLRAINALGGYTCPNCGGKTTARIGISPVFVILALLIGLPIIAVNIARVYTTNPTAAPTTTAAPAGGIPTPPAEAIPPAMDSAAPRIRPDFETRKTLRRVYPLVSADDTARAGVVPANAAVRILETDSNLVKIRFENVTGWIEESNLAQP
mgnify:CR=1 FL=1